MEAGGGPSHDLLPLGGRFGLVGVGHVLVDAPGDLESDMALVGEHLWRAGAVVSRSGTQP